MTVKTTGAEMKRFLEDRDFWQEAFMDDTLFSVNGVEVSDFETKRLADTAKITILGGVIEGHAHFNDLETMFKNWRKRDGHEEFVVRVPLGKKESLKKILKEIGGELV